VSDTKSTPEPPEPTNDPGEHDGVPTRVCPHCATISQTDGDFCPQCGKAFAKRPRLSKRARVAIIAGVAVLLVGGAGIGIALKVHNDEQVEGQHKAALAAANARQRAEKERAAASERAKTEGKEHEETERKSAESELEKAVEKDAKKLVSEGTLQEPILGASCSPVSGGSSTELNSTTGIYSCLAVTKREAGGESSGYAFTGNINFATGSFTYHLGH
jgi:hypothetical protein